MTTDGFPSHDRPSILVVDDVAANLELLSALLSERGYEPRPVLTGRLALLAARADPPDLVLLDIRMPDMDGFDVCARLKADAVLRDVPVIFISASNDTAEKVKAFSVGGVDYVTKPFQAAEIEARVRTHLSIRSLQIQLGAHNEQLERQVAERTRELAVANDRLRESGRLKDEFLAMISHELRTPANGVLGMGELIIGLCPPSDELSSYRDYFDRSRARLIQLIEDATMMADAKQLAPPDGAAVSCSSLVEHVRASLPGIRLILEPPADLAVVSLRGHRTLLARAMETLFRLAAAFSLAPHTVLATGSDEAHGLRIRVDVDALSLSGEDAAGFFELESSVRGRSAAEPLGLAPVVAQRILSALGGGMSLFKGQGRTGYLEAVFPKERNEPHPA